MVVIGERMKSCFPRTRKRVVEIIKSGGESKKGDQSVVSHFGSPVSFIELSPAIETQVPPPFEREGEIVQLSLGGEFMRIQTETYRPVCPVMDCID